jgi:hypothetical protein
MGKEGYIVLEGSAGGGLVPPGQISARTSLVRMPFQLISGRSR